jgi:hypothetical protein
MRFSVLLFGLYIVLKIAAFINKAFKKYIGKANVRVLIKTADGSRGRLFVFDKGKVRSEPGGRADCDVALVWQDAATGFTVLTDRKADASFNAAAEGKLRVEGMSVYAQWFETAVMLVMPRK